MHISPHRSGYPVDAESTSALPPEQAPGHDLALHAEAAAAGNSDAGTAIRHHRGSAAFLSRLHRQQAQQADSPAPADSLHPRPGTPTAVAEAEQQLARLNISGRGTPAETSAESRAAAKIQAAYRSYKYREGLALYMQEEPPYDGKVRYSYATHGYAPNILRERPLGSAQRAAEFGVYESTKYIPARQPAFLHSFQQREDFDAILDAYAPPRHPLIGNIYQPSVYGDGSGHDMRANSAWLLGLAHNNVGAILTTSLSDQTLVRDSAKNKPVNERNTEHNFSALGREVLGMVQNGHFSVVQGELGRQQLLPTASARLAKLEDFKTPPGMRKDEIKDRLAAAGVDVSRIS